ncbi:hypothetical protein B0H11DRAFT_733640 [Mycena galericulata]|nr:hypothetical protein B0H11DRAFT_733640 [Mycena galericulata]
MLLPSRSRIPVFTGLSSRTSVSGVFTPSSNSKPLLSASRIPRLKYTHSPASSRSSVSNTSASPFNVQTPCPSHTLAVEARQLAPRVVAPKIKASLIGSELETARIQPDVVPIMEVVASSMEVTKSATPERVAQAVEAGPPDNLNPDTAAAQTTGVSRSDISGVDKATRPSALEAVFAEMRSRLSGAVEARPSNQYEDSLSENSCGPSLSSPHRGVGRRTSQSAERPGSASS